MALVRVSKQLLLGVEQQIKVMAGAAKEELRKRAAPDAVPEVCADLVAAATAQMWGVYAHLKDTTPREWMLETPRLDITPVDDHKKSVVPEIQIKGDWRLPPGTKTDYGYAEVRVPVTALQQSTQDAVMEYAADAMALDIKYTTVKEQIISFPKNCKSLNDALKKFPDFALYVPDEYKKRVAVETERTRKKKAEAQGLVVAIDRELLTSVGVIGALRK